MDFHAAARDDVIPSARKLGVPEEKWYEDRTSLELECLHLYISEPKRERSFWVKQLPRLERLKFLEVKSRPNQELFEAICEVPNLERLDIYWSNILDLRPIAASRKLTHLNLGSSPKVQSLEPLRELKALVALGISGVKLCRDLSSIGSLRNLRGLSLSGGGYATLATTQVFDSLNRLSALHEIVYFSLVGVRTADRSLDAVSRFRKLKYLYLATLHNWPAEEYRRLHEALPDVQCEELRRAATDPAFQRANRIR